MKEQDRTLVWETLALLRGGRQTPQTVLMQSVNIPQTAKEADETRAQDPVRHPPLIPLAQPPLQPPPHNRVAPPHTTQQSQLPKGFMMSLWLGGVWWGGQPGECGLPGCSFSLGLGPLPCSLGSAALISPTSSLSPLPLTPPHEVCHFPPGEFPELPWGLMTCPLCSPPPHRR